jgi:hypothetical protein
MSLTYYGVRTCEPYSKCGLTCELKRTLNPSASSLLNVLLIIPRAFIALDAALTQILCRYPQINFLLFCHHHCAVLSYIVQCVAGSKFMSQVHDFRLTVMLYDAVLNPNDPEDEVPNPDDPAVLLHFGFTECL